MTYGQGKETMLTEAQKRWVDALRSGQYQQGHGKLHSDGFCCLGVACEIFKEELKLTEVFDEMGNFYTYNGCENFLPTEVMDHLGLTEVDGKFYEINESSTRNSLASMNDRGISFQKIADFIEQNPDKLFKTNNS